MSFIAPPSGPRTEPYEVEPSTERKDAVDSRGPKDAVTNYRKIAERERTHRRRSLSMQCFETKSTECRLSLHAVCAQGDNVVKDIKVQEARRQFFVLKWPLFLLNYPVRRAMLQLEVCGSKSDEL